MRFAVPPPKLLSIWRAEFQNYTRATFQRDLLAGLTVGAVALPLALAFGVASGSTPAAGLVTAIVAGLVIAGFGGSAYQISGPTGAMSAILIGLSIRYGMGGVWVAGLLAGAALIALGLFRLGRYISFIPSPVITGFTSGIALIIAIGQIDNVLGVKTEPAENALLKLAGYFTPPVIPDWHAVAVALIVIATMIALPRMSKRLPGSLIGIVLATLAVGLAGWDVPVIGAIPNTIVLDQRLSFGAIPWANLQDLIAPAIAIAALGAIETLLCGAVAGNMTGKPIDNNQELIGQGLGNLLIPFFGGVPATAAIARTSVAVKSGGVTRMASFVHAGVLLLSVFALGKLIGRVPLAALGGVLLVTAWRMNEWEAIRFFASKRLKHALAGMLVTMVATVALDLTQAILIGIAISAIIYLRQSASAASVYDEPIDLEKLRGNGYILERACPDVHVYYLTGPLFFGSVSTVMEIVGETHHQYRTLVLSMRGVPMIDVMGIHALEHLVRKQREHGGDVRLTSLQPAVRRMLERAGMVELLGEHNFFWSAVEAIVAAHNDHTASDCPHCKGLKPLVLGAEPRMTTATPQLA
jgi:sulfate permease, SulP family